MYIIIAYYIMYIMIASALMTTKVTKFKSTYLTFLMKGCLLYMTYCYNKSVPGSFCFCVSVYNH